MAGGLGLRGTEGTGGEGPGCTSAPDTAWHSTYQAANLVLYVNLGVYWVVHPGCMSVQTPGSTGLPHVASPLPPLLQAGACATQKQNLDFIADHCHCEVQMMAKGGHKEACTPRVAMVNVVHHVECSTPNTSSQC